MREQLVFGGCAPTLCRAQLAGMRLCKGAGVKRYAQFGGCAPTLCRAQLACLWLVEGIVAPEDEGLEPDASREEDLVGMRIWSITAY